MLTPRSPATSGSSPMITNSVVPMPNDAKASASKGRRAVGVGFCNTGIAGIGTGIGGHQLFWEAHARAQASVEHRRDACVRGGAAASLHIYGARHDAKNDL